jgi:L-ascorbate metabolism protein UlaG (beta-lactamase superfamily)
MFLKSRWFKFSAFAVVAAVSAVAFSGCTAIGTTPEGARLERVEKSAQWAGDHFRDVMPRIEPDIWPVFKDYFFDDTENRVPTEALPVRDLTAADFAIPPKDGLRITWLGHSTLLLEIDGYRVLVDPVWGERASPFSWIGPKRFHRPPLALKDLPKLDAIVISHDHYDHLDYPTILELAKTDVKFIMPLGVGSHLEYWGVPAERIVELEWWDAHQVGDLKLVATPARHFSGRSLTRNKTLWAGWAFVGAEHRIWYSGDTAMFDGIQEIGDRLGPFDVTIIETGAYNQRWADVHLGPEQAVQAHRMAGGKLMIPVHWGTFELALHSWTAPIERTVEAAKKCGIEVASPQPGGSVVPGSGQVFARWWPTVPYRNAREEQIVSSGFENRAATCATG